MKRRITVVFADGPDVLEMVVVKAETLWQAKDKACTWYMKQYGLTTMKGFNVLALHGTPQEIR